MVNNPHKSLKEKIFDVAHKEGLSDIGFTNPKLDPEEFKNFKEFIHKGYHGQMYWLNKNIDWTLFGVFSALGFLSKYLFIYILISLLIFFTLNIKKYQKSLKEYLL